MLISSNDVQAKLNELLDYSCNQFKVHTNEYTSIVNAYIQSVTAYFNVDRTKYKEQLKYLKYYASCDIRNRLDVRKSPVPLNDYYTNYPKGYKDLREIFSKFECMECTNDDFYNAFEYVLEDLGEYDENTKSASTTTTDTETGETITNTIDVDFDNHEVIVKDNHAFYRIATNNTLIDTWSKGLNADNELNDIVNLNNWLCASNDVNEDILFWEKVETIKSTSTEQIANILYIDRHWKECIQSLNLPMHVPSYI